MSCSIFLFLALITRAFGQTETSTTPIADDNLTAAIDATPNCLTVGGPGCQTYSTPSQGIVKDYTQLMYARRGIFNLAQQQQDEDYMCPLRPEKYGANPPWYAYQAIKAHGPAIAAPTRSQFNNRTFTMFNMCPKLDAHWFGCVSEGGEFKARVRSVMPPEIRPHSLLGNMNCSLRDVSLFKQKKSDELAIRFDYGMCSIGNAPATPEMEQSVVVGIHKVPDEKITSDTHVSDFFGLICADQLEVAERRRRLSEEEILREVEEEIAKREEIDKDFFHTGPAPHAEARRLNFWDNIGSMFGGGESTVHRHSNFMLNSEMLDNSWKNREGDMLYPPGGCLASNAEYARCLSPTPDCFKPFHMLTLLDRDHKVASIPVAESRFEALATKFFGKSTCPSDLRECPDGSWVDRDPENNCFFRRCSQSTGRRMGACDGDQTSPCATENFFTGTPPPVVSPCDTTTPPPTTTLAPTPAPPPGTTTPWVDPCTTTTTTIPIVPGQCFYDLLCVQIPGGEGCNCHNDCIYRCTAINSEGTSPSPPPNYQCCDDATCCWSVELQCLLVPLFALLGMIALIPWCIEKMELRSSKISGEVQFETEATIAGAAPHLYIPPAITRFFQSSRNYFQLRLCAFFVWPLILAIVCFGLGFLMQLLYKEVLNEVFGKDPACPCDLWQYLTAMWITASIVTYFAATSEINLPETKIQTYYFTEAEVVRS